MESVSPREAAEAEKTKGFQKVGGGVAYTIGKFHKVQISSYF